MIRKGYPLAALGLAVVLFFTGCGGDSKSRDNGDDAGSLEDDIVTDADAPTDAESGKEGDDAGNTAVAGDTAGDTDTGQDGSEDAGQSEKDLYWESVLEEFKDSQYDLTAALTGPALKDLASKYFMLGVGINGSTLENQTLNMPEYMAVCRKHFNSCTMTNLMKSCYILVQDASRENLENGDGSPVLSYASIDPTLQWCMDNGMQMRGHTLVWHAQAPGWFFREGYTDDGAFVDKDTMLFRMESYIRQLMTHVQENYPGVVYCWDVVNEAVDPDNGDPDSSFRCRTKCDDGVNPWYATIGEDYVEMAFTYARKYAADGVKLFYNDYNTYQSNKTQAIIALCESLKEKNLIDGIGMQGYWGIDYPSTVMIETAIRLFSKLDLEIHITEWSTGVEEENEEQFKKQAQKYATTLLAIISLDQECGGPANITSVTFFGLIDHYREGDTTNTRLFDSEYQPKPAFERILDILKFKQ